ncbi:unnamed protein product [Larinioides sclopetarius]|uniref:Uncharacterized protein n=1 Tax=Larinioides sclopetarius TaxID=280406 RepID=A0AAV2BLS1_9ARAC
MVTKIDIRLLPSLFKLLEKSELPVMRWNPVESSFLTAKLAVIFMLETVEIIL